MSKTTFVDLLTIFFIASCSTTYGYDECISAEPTNLDYPWSVEVTKNGGLHMIEHSSCNNCGKEQGWEWKKGRSTPNRACRDIELETKGGASYTLPFICEAAVRLEDINCQIDNSRSKIKDLDIAGRFVVTLTDNSTFIAGTTCMFGKENFWWFLGVTTEVSPETKSKVEEHFTKMGFKAPVAVAGKDPVIIKKFTFREC